MVLRKVEGLEFTHNKKSSKKSVGARRCGPSKLGAWPDRDFKVSKNAKNRVWSVTSTGRAVERLQRLQEYHTLSGKRILSNFYNLGHLGDFLGPKSSPKPVRSLDYIDRADSNRRTVSRRDKILAAAPLSLRTCQTRVFWVTIDSEPSRSHFWPLRRRF